MITTIGKSSFSGSIAFYTIVFIATIISLVISCNKFTKTGFKWYYPLAISLPLTLLNFYMDIIKDFNNQSIGIPIFIVAYFFLFKVVIKEDLKRTAILLVVFLSQAILYVPILFFIAVVIFPPLGQ